MTVFLPIRHHYSWLNDWSIFMEKCIEDHIAEDRRHYNIILSDRVSPDRIEIVTKDDRREIVNIKE